MPLRPANISVNVTPTNMSNLPSTTEMIKLSPELTYILIGILAIIVILVLIKIFYKPKPIPQTENAFVEKLVKHWREEGKNYNSKALYKVYVISKMKGWMDFKTLGYKLTSTLHPLSALMVNMQMENGTFYQFVTKIQDGGFKFDKGFYIFDDLQKYYSSSSNMWCCDYHESLCFPIKRTINIDEIKKNLYESHEVELETSMNPVSLQKWQESTIIQKLLAGAELEDALRLMKTLIIITLVIVTVTLLVCAKIAGFFGK
jgi:hypothetical protein